MSERVCQSCGAPLPADAHPHRRACSAACQRAAANANRRQTRGGPEYRAKVRERDERKREAERAAAAKRTAGARRQFDGDRIKAALREREAQVIEKWRERS